MYVHMHIIIEINQITCFLDMETSKIKCCENIGLSAFF